MCKYCIVKSEQGTDYQIRQSYYCRLAEDKNMTMRCRVKGNSAECKKGEE